MILRALLIFFVTFMPLTVTASSLDDLLTADTQTPQNKSTITKQEYFGKIKNSILKNMTIPRHKDRLKYMYQDVERLPIAYHDSNDREVFKKINAILKNEYQFNFKSPEQASNLIRTLHYLSQLNGFKFVKEYLISIHYIDKGIQDIPENYPEDLKRRNSVFFRLDQKMNRNLEYFQKNMKRYSSEIMIPVKNFISDYNEFLVKTYKEVTEQLNYNSNQDAIEFKKLKTEYQRLLNTNYNGIKPKRECVDFVISGLQQTSFSSTFDQESCKYLDAYYFQRNISKCDVMNALQFIADHPIMSVKMIIPLENENIDYIVRTVDPIRVSAKAAINSCKFSGR